MGCGRGPGQIFWPRAGWPHQGHWTGRVSQAGGGAPSWDGPSAGTVREFPGYMTVTAGWASWSGQLPEALRAARSRWGVREGQPFCPGGTNAWVAPAAGPDGQALVLKLIRPGFEAEHEVEGLRRWDGRATARLIAADDFGEVGAILLERCLPGTALAALPELEQDPVVASLLRRIWIDPGPRHPFRPLAEMCDRWAEEFERLPQDQGRLGSGDLVAEGLRLWRELSHQDVGAVLLFTDLHAGNVLAASREPWLAIDPKPHVGDPTYDALQHMLNCPLRLSSDPEGLILRMADLLDLDAARLRLWMFARCVLEQYRSPLLARVARRLAPRG